MHIAISKKAGGAVVRNRLKRVVREVIRNMKQQVPEGMKVRVFMRRGIEEGELRNGLAEGLPTLMERASTPGGDEG